MDEKPTEPITNPELPPNPDVPTTWVTTRSTGPHIKGKPLPWTWIIFIICALIIFAFLGYSLAKKLKKTQDGWQVVYLNSVPQIMIGHLNGYDLTDAYFIQTSQSPSGSPSSVLLKLDDQLQTEGPVHLSKEQIVYIQNLRADSQAVKTITGKQ